MAAGITNLPQSFAQDSGTILGESLGQKYTLQYSVSSGKVSDIFFDDSGQLHIRTTPEEDRTFTISTPSIIFGSMDSTCIAHAGYPIALVDGEETEYQSTAVGDRFKIIIDLPEGKSTLQLVPSFVPETPQYIKNCENPIAWAKQTIGGKFFFFYSTFYRAWNN